ncbi:MAG: EipA family protein [Hyphomicrobiaceae bacterium]|nr:EipA family protein [Hyphomicrobiaceae bacterium]
MAGLGLCGGPSLAAGCSKDDFAKAVDLAGAALRKVSAESMPRIQTKMRQVKDKRGWPDQGFEEKAFAALQDERIAQFDAQANDLLSKLDNLGSFSPSTEADCARLEELNATSLELLATVKAKAAYSLSKLDQMLADAPALPAPQGDPIKALIVEDQKTKEPKPAAKPAEKRAPAPKVAQKETEPVRPAQTKSEPLPARSEAPRPEPRREAAAQPVPLTEPPTLQPAPNAPPPQVLPPEEEGYTIEEIKAASAGVFGKVSANVAAVIEHVFSKSGRPRAYVLGEEGGGAFIAGVRYGEGTLYLREGGTQKIFWHGPSLGTDIGGDGSKTLFLIYGLKSPEQLYSNYTGVAGSAYLVGGVGATFNTNGEVILAPIRSGLGLRIGANIGYIRFTPKQTWNPF